MAQTQHIDRHEMNEKQLHELMLRLGLTDDEMLKRYKSILSGLQERQDFGLKSEMRAAVSHRM